MDNEAVSTVSVNWMLTVISTNLGLGSHFCLGTSKLKLVRQLRPCLLVWVREGQMTVTAKTREFATLQDSVWKDKRTM